MNTEIQGSDDLARGEGYLGSLFRHLGVALLGATFALSIYKVWALEGRWFFIVITAVVLLAVSAMAVSQFSRLLLILLMFGLPFAGFGKWLFTGGFSSDIIANQVYSGLISIGIYEFMLAGLYMSWFFRIFISREQKIPGIKSLDWWVLGVVLSYLISIPGSLEPRFGIFSTVHLLKHVALYFYVSRNFQYRHVKWFLIAMIFTIFVNTALSAYQKLTGNLVGIALDKGAGSSQLNTAYTVYKLNSTRSTGTTYDSHALGMLMVIAIQFCLVFLLRPNMRFLYRFITLGVMGMATATLFFSYSRTAWLGGLGTSFLLLSVMLFRWRNTRVLSFFGLGLVIGLLASPWLIELVIERFQRGTTEVMGYRMDQWTFAFRIWLEKPFFGHGVGNYMGVTQTVKDFGNMSDLPVHNMYLWILCDTGIFGTVLYWGMILAAMRRLWQISEDNRSIISCLSMAIIASFVEIMIDAITNPIQREPMVFILLWFFVAFAVVFPKFRELERKGILKDDSQLT